MGSRNYERLSIEKFGEHLLLTGDLDPVYIALDNLLFSGWLRPQVQRFLVAYWCLYHCGAAAHLSTFTGGKFWKALGDAAENAKPAPTGGRWPRGSERRHWRGKQALASWADLNLKYKHPEQMVDYILGSEQRNMSEDYAKVAKRAADHKGFGPWIAFKIADMVDRVLGKHVNFDEAAVFMFKDPVKAALMLYGERSGLPAGWRPKDEAAKNRIIHEVVEYLTKHFDAMTAPPRHERPVGLQEVETILCKWKSHLNGHYPLGNDITEIREGLAGWGPAADDFLHAMPVLPSCG